MKKFLIILSLVFSYMSISSHITHAFVYGDNYTITIAQAGAFIDENQSYIMSGTTILAGSFTTWSYEYYFNAEDPINVYYLSLQTINKTSPFHLNQTRFKMIVAEDAWDIALGGQGSEYIHVETYFLFVGVNNEVWSTASHFDNTEEDNPLFNQGLHFTFTNPFPERMVTTIVQVAKMVTNSNRSVLNVAVDDIMEILPATNTNNYEIIVRGGFSSTLAQAYEQGKADGIQEGLINGRSQGIINAFNNGTAYYGLIPADSYDYVIGFSTGRNQNVNAGITGFLSGFEKWIVPAILLVILLGGFITVKASRRD